MAAVGSFWGPLAAVGSLRVLRGTSYWAKKEIYFPNEDLYYCPNEDLYCPNEYIERNSKDHPDDPSYLRRLRD